MGVLSGRRLVRKGPVGPRPRPRGTDEGETVRSLSAFSAAIAVLVLGALTGTAVWADEPKPTPENTISLHLAEPVAPQKLAGPPKFFITEVTDRSGNPEPRIVFKERGG